MPKTTKYTGTFKSVIDVSLLAAEGKGKLPKRIKVLPCGEFNTMPYGPLTIDDGVCSQMVANFNSDIRKAVPIDVDHDGGKAAGWINKLEAVAGDGVYAFPEWTRYGKDLLENKEYRLFSPEWSFDYIDPEKSTHHGAVLVAGSLTNRPLFKELPILVANDGTVLDNKENLTEAHQIVLLFNQSNDTTMNIAEILAKKPQDRTPEEVEFLKSAELNDEQKAQLEAEEKEAQDEGKEEEKEDEGKEAEGKEEEKEEEKEEAEDEDKEEGQEEGQEEGATNATASEDQEVTIKASELKRYKEMEQQATRTAAEKEVGQFMANANGGKLYPKSKEALVNFVLTCSESQKTQLFELLKTLPDLKIAGEQGSDDDAGASAQDKINKLVLEKVKADEKLNVSEATRQVLQENTDLAKQYDEELKSK